MRTSEVTCVRFIKALTEQLYNESTQYAFAKNTTGHQLEQNFPNEMTESTTINFSLAYEDAVNLQIFDSNGNIVQVIIDNQTLGQGKHTATWNRTSNGKRLPNGMYFYKMTTENFSETKRILLK